MEITIHEVSGAELHCRYPREHKPQKCFVELDVRTGDLSAEYNGEIGNAVPFDVHNCHRLRWSIPALRDEAANALLAEIAPLAERLVAGASEHWDGSNAVSLLDADAKMARGEIERICERAGGEGSELVVWDAADWFAPLGSRHAQATELGIVATTTDAELSDIAARELAKADGVDEIEDCEEYLAKIRDGVVEAAKEES